MESIRVNLFVDDNLFAPVLCPACHNAENLDRAVTGLWDCPACGAEFWISLARVVTAGEPSWIDLVYEIPGRDNLDPKSLTNE